MDFTLSAEQEILKDSIIKFAQAELNDSIIERDKDHQFNRELWVKCAEVGIQGLPIPEEYGGTGADPLTTAVALEALGFGSRDSGLNFSICAHMLACAIPIWKHGTETQKAKFLPALCDGSTIAANAMTEADTGSDSFSMNTKAVACDGGYRLNGSKTFCTNAPIADLAVVYAITDPEQGYFGGVTAFIVEKDSIGYSQGQEFDKMGLRTSPIGELVFDDVFVPDENVLGGEGSGSIIFTESMDWERALLIACHVGAMDRLLNEATNYARDRRQYGHPIGKFQAISHRVSEMKVKIEAGRLLTYKAAASLDSKQDAGLFAAIAKLYVSESFTTTAHDAIRIMGGYGFMTESDVERTFRDSIGGTIYSGTSEIQKNIISRWMRL